MQSASNFLYQLVTPAWYSEFMNEEISTENASQAPNLSPQIQERLKDLAEWTDLYKKLDFAFPPEGLLDMLDFAPPDYLNNFKADVINYQEIEASCDRLMELSLKIHETVCEDVAEANGRDGVDIDGTKLKGAALLIRQKSYGDRPESIAPFKAFFTLPKAYRLVVNLVEDFERKEALITRIGQEKLPKELSQNIQNLPSDWKDKFFAKGTKQAEWRKRYHELRERTFALCGSNVNEGEQAIQKADQRFTQAMGLHQDKNFSRQITSECT